MTPKLEQELYEKYPEIFRDRDGDPKQTAMCWGISVDDGWYHIIDTLCRFLMSDYLSIRRSLEYRKKREIAPGSDDKIAELERELENAKSKIPVAIQVKEKFGSLRFHVVNASEKQRAYIDFAEAMSETTCEACGNVGKQRNTGWIKVLCDVHAKNRGYIEEDE